ncbi:MAG: YidC/Oxa1 family insertase periplasmic-domain containing protein [Holophaga sp.]|nr:YidC/Oxa1 family insertase periplasmic-domain containing protein [Holophaga sp.]
MLIFVVLSVLLLGGYNLLMTRLNPPRPAIVQTQGPAQAPVPSAPAKASVATSAAPLPPVGAVDPLARVSFQNDALKLTWRKGDGALVQVEWNDGTEFFPEAKQKDGTELSKDFPGLGGAVNTRFEGEPQIAGTPEGHTVTFRNGQGDQLTYLVPAQGHVVSMEWASPRGAALNLLPKPSNALEVQGLGRMFTIEHGSIKAVAWTAMLKDPFFSFLGSKRKDLPPASRWLGMDAGTDPKKPTQTTHYFAAIWDVSRETVRNLDSTPGYLLTPDGTGKASARLYLGPKQSEALGLFHAPGQPEEGKMFKQVVDFGFFGLVAQFLFYILRGLHSVVPNWGWSIILLTVVIRGALWPLNTKTTVQMVRMKELEPFQKALQAKYEKFGNDMAKKAEMQKELMAFYKKNGHNPMGGCLPMLLQMPVFFALWSMLNAVFELRHAPFLGWLTDLSAQDPFYILPVLMGVSMIIQQAMTPAVGDPAQRKMMMVLMPVMFSFFFARTPSGLCLYYLMFNIIGILQTWLVIKTYKPQPVVA